MKSNNAVKSDIVNFIVFKRKLRIQLHRLNIVFTSVIIIALSCLCIAYKAKIAQTFANINNKFTYICEQLFTIKVKKVKINVEKNSMLDESELERIASQVYATEITKSKMQQIIKDITDTNPLVQNIYMYTNISSEEMTIFLKEKKIIGIFYSDNCSHELNNFDKCTKNIISANNQLLPYHKLKNSDEIIKVYGKFGNTDLNKIRKLLKKYALIAKVDYLKFYLSGRFDLILKNKLVLKFPRNNLQKAFYQFNKLDSEYLLTKDDSNIKIKYIDLRSQDKAYIGV